MNPKPNLSVLGGRIAMVSSVVAALLAAGYATAEHHHVIVLQHLLMAQQQQQQSNTDCGCVDETAAGPGTADDNDALPKVRQAARDFISETRPSAKAEGVFTLALRGGNLYIAGVDATDGGVRRTVDLLVRLYTKKSGGQYWRAESLGADRAASLMDRVSEATAPTDASADNDGPAGLDASGQAAK
jgi:hypothetical protein